MGKLIKIKIGEEEIWWEAEKDARADRGPQDVSKSPIGKVLDSAGEAVNTIKTYCSLLYRAFQEIDDRPDKVTAEFGIKLSGEGNVYVVKTVGEASLKVTAEWNHEK